MAPKPIATEPPPIDFNAEIDKRRSTTVDAPATKNTGINQGVGGGKGSGTEPIRVGEPYSAKLGTRLNNAYVGLTAEQKQAGEQGKSSWMGNPFAKVGLGLLNYTVLKPLQILDVGRRVIQSGIKNQADVYSGNQSILEAAKDFYNEVKDPNLDSKKLFNINTSNIELFGISGNKWVDRTLSLALDIGLDPTTYLTLGTGTAAKIALKQVGETTAKAIVKQASEELATKGVKEVEKTIAKKLVVELGEKATAKEIRVASRAAVAEGAKLAAAEGVEDGAKKAAQAAARYSAVGPRRALGAGAREARANGLRQLRAEALQDIASETTSKTAKAVAQRFVDTVDENVIADIARRGAAGITDDVARELGISGGLRIGAFGARTGLTTSIGKTAPLTRGVGKFASGIRMRTMNLPTGPKGRIIADLFTPRGATEAVYLARTGLRSNRILDPLTNKYRNMTKEETFDALQTIASDATLKQINAAAAAPIRIAVANIAKKEYRPYYTTVNELAGLDLTKPLAELTEIVKRPVAAKEVELARAIEDFGRETFDAISPTLIAPPGAYPKNWFPEVLTNDAIRFLNSGTEQAEAVVKALGLTNPPLPGQSIANALEPKIKFFDTTLPDKGSLNIKALNKAARDAGFKGDFFETNAFKAIQKFANKYKQDYALARLIGRGSDEVSRALAETGSTTGLRPTVFDKTTEVLTKADEAGGVRLSTVADELRSGTIDELSASNAFSPWFIEDIRRGEGELIAAKKRLKDTAFAKDKRDSIEQAINELEQIFRTLRTTIEPNEFGVVDEIGDAWGILGADLQNQYITLFARPKEQVLTFLNKLNPEQLKNMVNLNEDAFVLLDSIVAPDALVRADIANVYKNVQKLRDPKYANDALQTWDAFTQSIKSWYTATPGFHVRNGLSNWFMMTAGGAKQTYMREGITVSNNWNKFLKEEARQAASRGDAFIFDNEQLINKFIKGSNPKLPNYNKYSGLVPKNQRYAAQEALRTSGGAGFGDLEEVFSKATGKVGATGKEATGVINVPFTNKGIEVRGLKKTSEIIGSVPTTSRKVGNAIEDHSRFIFTFDGIRQGLDPQESVQRTAKFLIDYSDLSKLDEVAKRFVPFWMFMSRNLPTQLINMYTSPGLYQKYNAFRRNIEDENGKNYLTPSYLTKAGATIVGTIPGVGGVAFKPDLGFPGAGSPSPLTASFQAGSYADALKGLTQGLNPAIQAGVELGSGRDLFTGQEMGGKELGLSLLEKLLPQASVASRYLNPLFAGTESPVGNLPGIYQSETGKGNIKDTPDNVRKAQALASLLGIPVGLITANEENSRVYELIKALESYQTKK